MAKSYVVNLYNMKNQSALGATVPMMENDKSNELLVSAIENACKALKNLGVITNWEIKPVERSD